ncbi:hypothetical protein LFX25_02195 [Leptospira sp. FAT2]|uniref:hypothetical protein n=1 Tax=Leptospira sanjuanensis TaxID=2879643 RepID=UPI001EE7EC6B|nr:hypothetical protein [Leptospira sanjuanensis]MCG6166661.1 hypothetical protein [Leptospira sanjuanensis]MCG6192053.1 hypothetical protein [Leptospira sanjuanensis]
MAENFLDNFKYDADRVNKGIDKAISREKNSAPRYNPYFLLQETPELDAAIERDLKAQSVRKFIRSGE